MLTRINFRRYIIWAIITIAAFIPMQLMQLNFQKYAEKKHWDTWLSEGKMLDFFSIVNTHYYWGLLGFLLGCGFVSWIFRFIPESKIERSITTEANLILYFYEDSRQPEVKGNSNNIWRWYYLQNVVNYVDKRTEEVMTITTSSLFITFDKPLDKLGNVKLNPIGFHLPKYEIKDFSDRSLVIGFFDKVPAGELQIHIK